ncbi:unnamed protein product [Musa textilis]
MLKRLLLHLEVTSCFQAMLYNSSNACIIRWLTNASSLAHIGNLQTLQVLHLSLTLLPGNHQKQLANSASCSSWIYQINHLTGQMPRTLGGWTSPQTHQKATSLKHIFPISFNLEILDLPYSSLKLASPL